MKKTKVKRYYVSGPMRGYAEHNFPAFDAATLALQANGYEVISPADLDRQSGYDPSYEPTDEEVKGMLIRDIEAVLTCDGIVLLEGWLRSEGARMELTVAASLNQEIYLYMDNGSGVLHLEPMSKEVTYDILSGDTFHRK